MFTIKNLMKGVEQEIPSLKAASNNKGTRKQIKKDELFILYAGYKHIESKLKEITHYDLLMINNLFKNILQHIDSFPKDNLDLNTLNKNLEDFEKNIWDSVNTMQLEMIKIGLNKDANWNMTHFFDDKFKEMFAFIIEQTAQFEANENFDFSNYSADINNFVQSFANIQFEIQKIILETELDDIKSVQNWFLDLAPTSIASAYEKFEKKYEVKSNKVANNNQIFDIWLETHGKIINKQTEIKNSIRQLMIDEIDSGKQTILTNEYEQYNNEQKFFYANAWKENKFYNETVNSLEDLKRVYQDKDNQLFTDFFRKFLILDDENIQALTFEENDKSFFLKELSEQLSALNYKNLITNFVAYLQTQAKQKNIEIEDFEINELAKNLITNWSQIFVAYQKYNEEQQTMIREMDNQAIKWKTSESLTDKTYNSDKTMLVDFIRLQQYNQEILEIYRNREVKRISDDEELKIIEKIEQLQIFKTYPDLKDYNYDMLEFQKNFFEKQNLIQDELIKLNLEFWSPSDKLKSISWLDSQEKKIREKFKLSQDDDKKKSLQTHKDKLEIFKKYPHFAEYEKQIYETSENIYLYNNEKMAEITKLLGIDTIDFLNQTNKFNEDMKMFNEIDAELQQQFAATPYISKFKKQFKKEYKTKYKEDLSDLETSLAKEKSQFSFTTKLKKILTLGLYKTKKEKEIAENKETRLTLILKKDIRTQYDNWLNDEENDVTKVQNKEMLWRKMAVKTEKQRLEIVRKQLTSKKDKIKKLENDASRWRELIHNHEITLEQLKTNFETFNLKQIEKVKIASEELLANEIKIFNEQNEHKNDQALRLLQKTIFANYCTNPEFVKNLFKQLEKSYGNSISATIIENLNSRYKSINEETYFNKTEKELTIDLIKNIFTYCNARPEKSGDDKKILKTAISTLVAESKQLEDDYDQAATALFSKRDFDKKIANWINEKVKYFQNGLENNINSDNSENLDDPFLKNLVDTYRSHVNREIRLYIEKCKKFLDVNDEENKAVINEPINQNSKTKQNHQQDYIVKNEFEKLFETLLPQKANNVKKKRSDNESQIFEKFLHALNKSTKIDLKANKPLNFKTYIDELASEETLSSISEEKKEPNNLITELSNDESDFEISSLSSNESDSLKKQQLFNLSEGGFSIDSADDGHFALNSL